VLRFRAKPSPSVDEYDEVIIGNDGFSVQANTGREMLKMNDLSERGQMLMST
jgi:hypothetical protein